MTAAQVIALSFIFIAMLTAVWLWIAHDYRRTRDLPDFARHLGDYRERRWG